MLADYHIHTHLCGHANGDPDEYTSNALKNGIQEICFTDHAPDPDGYDPGNRMSIDKFPEYRNIVASAKDNNPELTILYGVEADYYPGCERFLNPWLKENDFDLVLGSVHYIKEWGFDNPAEKKVWESVNINNAWSDYFSLIGKLADSSMYDIIGHLDLPKKFGHRPPDDELSSLASSALDKIAQANMSIELNTSGLRKPAKEIYPSLLLLKMARKRNISICFGSDSHSPIHVGCDFNKALKLAKEAGYSECARYRKRKKTLFPLPAHHAAEIDN